MIQKLGKNDNGNKNYQFGHLACLYNILQAMSICALEMLVLNCDGAMSVIFSIEEGLHSSPKVFGQTQFSSL